MSDIKRLFDKLTVAPPGDDTILTELKAALDAGDKGRILWWTGQLGKAVGELMSEVMGTYCWDLGEKS